MMVTHAGFALASQVLRAHPVYDAPESASNLTTLATFLNEASFLARLGHLRKSLSFFASVGIFFRDVPALRASRLDPVEAIRHE
jgi:hypothetical protein